MKTSSSQRLLYLGTGELLRIDAKPGRSVVVFAGKVWITQEGDSADHVLAAGESFVCDRGGLAIVQALEPARLVVLADARAAVEAIGYEAAWPVTGSDAIAVSPKGRRAADPLVSYA